jgi:hypothetical protein
MKLKSQVLGSELELLEQKAERSQKHLNDLTMQIGLIQQEMDDYLGHVANEAAAFPMTDLETTDLLIRNCVVELQRLKWEVIAEETLAKQEPSSEDEQLLKRSIQMQEAKWNALNESFSIIESNAKKGGHRTETPEQANLKMIEARGNLQVAALERDHLKATLESLNAKAAGQAAGKLKLLKQREAGINSQLEILRSHRTALLRMVESQAKVKSLREVVTESQRELIALEKQMREKSVLLSTIGGALSTFEKKRASKTKEQNNSSDKK